MVSEYSAIDSKLIIQGEQCRVVSQNTGTASNFKICSKPLTFFWWVVSDVAGLFLCSYDVPKRPRNPFLRIPCRFLSFCIRVAWCSWYYYYLVTIPWIFHPRTAQKTQPSAGDEFSQILAIYGLNLRYGFNPSLPPNAREMLTRNEMNPYRALSMIPI